MYEKFKGIFPALLTPFNEKDEVDYGSLEKLIEVNLKAGVKGFYVDGSTGEAFLLSFEERKEVIQAVSRIVNGRCTLIAQIGCIATKQAIELAKVAESSGYDAVSSVAPFYYKFGFEEIKKYYFDIVDAVNIPMIIYNIPTFSGVNLSLSQMGEFLKDSRFIGIKHTSTDYFALEQFKAAFPEKILFNGFDETCLAGLAMGADGAIGSTYNFMADKFIKIQKLFCENNVKEAQKVQLEANFIIAELCKVGVMQGEKYLVEELFNIPMGKVRAPFKELTDEQKHSLKCAVTPYLPF